MSHPDLTFPTSRMRNPAHGHDAVEPVQGARCAPPQGILVVRGVATWAWRRWRNRILRFGGGPDSTSPAQTYVQNEGVFGR